MNEIISFFYTLKLTFARQQLSHFSLQSGGDVYDPGEKEVNIPHHNLPALMELNMKSVTTETHVGNAYKTATEFALVSLELSRAGSNFVYFYINSM